MTASLFAIAAATLAACGGGGGGGTGGGGILPGTPAPGGTPTPVPTANASGKVVDYDTQAPLAGVPVAIASWAPNASPVPVATTAADGTFSFKTAAGTYELQIGSNSATDSRTTLVQQITLKGGNNPLVVASPPPQPYVTPDPVQTSGNYRLKQLSTDDKACIGYANTDFGSFAGPFAEDEFIWESNHWANEQNFKSGATSGSVQPSTGWMTDSTLSGYGAMLTALNEPIGARDYAADGLLDASQESGAVQLNVSDLVSYHMIPWRYAVNCDIAFQAEVMYAIDDPR